MIAPGTIRACGFCLALLPTLASCGSAGEGGAAGPALAGDSLRDFPASLVALDEGFPEPGDPCRLLGESEATSNFRDEGALLVGCLSDDWAAGLGGRIVGTLDGVTLVTLPVEGADEGLSVMALPVDPDLSSASDPGTDYHAIAQVGCGFDGAAPTRTCAAGVKRNWGEDGTTLVEVVRPGGRPRAIFYQDTTAYGADSAQSDGSAGWDFSATRQDDEVTIRFGPETYVIRDTVVQGS